MEDTSQKPQASELLRQANNLVITTSANPNVDKIAALIALKQVMDKLGKRAEAVLSSPIPASLNFLPTQLLHKQFEGLRDFVIELDTSRTEADKLKYIPEDKKLKIYITPFNGSFEKSDVTFSYGEYRADALVVLGAHDAAEVDPVLSSHKDLMGHKLVMIDTGALGGGVRGNQIIWTEPQASSICEMLISMIESLQMGLDSQIATSLLTGIVSATNHFTGTNTTPKLMTIAAQLLAAGGDQATIIKNLEQRLIEPKVAEPAKPSPTSELKPAQEKSLPHHGSVKAKVGLGKSAHHSKKPSQHNLPKFMISPPAQGPHKQMPSSPAPMPSVQPPPSINSAHPNFPTGSSGPVDGERLRQIEEARKAVEEAERHGLSRPQPPLPPLPGQPSSPPQAG